MGLELHILLTKSIAFIWYDMWTQFTSHTGKMNIKS